MMQTTAVVIGAGHAGLAMSRRLTERSIDHVVLERGEVANSWRTQRWASLRLLTPNWLTRLPGYDYAGNDPDGYLPAAGVVATLTRYARFAAAPVCTATTVHTVRTTPGGFEIQANDDMLHARAVVLATGACARPAIPAITGAVPRPITTLTPLTYHDPSQLPDGGVLVIGASATGVQLAGEIRRSGRPVTLAVGEHVRLPRHYRGRDIFWWLEATGVLAERYDQVDDLTRARHLPSPQLTGTPEPPPPTSTRSPRRVSASSAASAGFPRRSHGLRSPRRPPALLPQQPAPMTTRWTPRTAGRALPSRGSKGGERQRAGGAGQPARRGDVPDRVARPRRHHGGYHGHAGQLPRSDAALQRGHRHSHPPGAVGALPPVHPTW
jgi:cation diffusion facilitator CzcD-associated flavoprotein CzcO